MSAKKRKLSKAQLEVHRACFGTDSDSDSQSQTAAPATNASQGVIEKELYMCPDGSTLDLTEAVQRAVNKRMASLYSNVSQTSGCPASSPAGKTSEKVQTQGQAGHDPLYMQEYSSLSEESDSEQDSDCSDLGELIGASVNSNAHKTKKSENSSQPGNFDFFNLGDLSSPRKTSAAGTESAVPGSSKLPEDTVSPVVEVDPDLPGCKKLLANFEPDTIVVNWAREQFSDTPRAKEKIKELEEQFIPVPSCQDLFSPIKSSDFILKAMQDRDNIAADTIYFDRIKCERLLYKSQQLLGLAFSPFMDALSKLRSVPGGGVARNLIGTGIQAVASARQEISFARRELCRKLIRSDVYPHLYNNQPTYSQLFGGESFEVQVVKAKQAAKQCQEFIYKKPKQKPAPKSANSAGFPRGRSQNSQRSENTSTKGRGGYQKRRRGKGKGQAKSSATKDDTNN